MKRKIPRHVRMDLKVRDIMTREVATIPANAMLVEAARIMRDRDVGLLPVLDKGSLVGLITDRDMVVRAVAAGRDLKRTRVRSIMTPEVCFCYPHEDVIQAVEAMEAKQIRRVLVLNRKKQLVGVLSVGDLAVDTGDRNLAGELLKMVSEPEP